MTKIVRQQRSRQFFLCTLGAVCTARSFDSNNADQWSGSYQTPVQDDEIRRGDQGRQWVDDRQPPPPPQYDQSQYNPINYQFRSRQQDSLQNPDSSNLAQQTPAGDDDIPVTMISEQHPEYDPDAPKFATPRQDAISRYMSTFNGRLALRSSSGLVGGALGAFVGKSLLNSPVSMALLTSILFVLLTFIRNSYGELSKALGLTLIYVWQRTFSIRRRYPTWPHLKACLGIQQRRPFPRNDDFSAREISYISTLIAMGFVGSTCGGCLPLIPTWMGALGGAGMFVFVATLRNARGDLARSMGMRVVAVVEELLDINQELRVVQKSGVVAGKILDKILILDRKHRIKDRIAAGLSFVYDQVARTASQIQGEEGRNDKRGNDRRDNAFRFEERGRQGRVDQDRGDQSERDSYERRDPRDQGQSRGEERRTGSWQDGPPSDSRAFERR